MNKRQRKKLDKENEDKFWIHFNNGGKIASLNGGVYLKPSKESTDIIKSECSVSDYFIQTGYLNDSENER